MTEKEFNQKLKDGEVEAVKPETPQTPTPPTPAFDENEPLLDAMRRPKKSLSTPPTFSPKNFAEQFQVVVAGGLKSLWMWIDQTWVELAGSAGGAAGDDQEVQFNDGGAMGADPNFKWNATEKRIELDSNTNIPALKRGNGNGSILVEGGDATIGDSPGGQGILRGGLGHGTGPQGNGGPAVVAGGYAEDVDPYTADGGPAYILGGGGLNPGPIYMGVTQIERSGPGIFTERRYGRLTTTNATQATLMSFTIPDYSNRAIRAYISAYDTNPVGSGNSAAYVLTALYKRSYGGSTTLVGSIQNDFTAEDNAAWDATLDISDNAVRVRVTGQGSTNIFWKCELFMWGGYID